MSAILPGSSVQNTYMPLAAGSKVGGNIGKDTTSASSFASMFTDAVREMQELESVKSDDSLNLAIGDVDNLSELMVNSERAQAAFQLLVQMRNKILDSYSEIMRMNV